ncbi:molybdopterin-dependent oxidoreductase [Spirosoma sp. HMF3257]|uniref:Xanthine dehydrogenase family protein molybdopterin-binding subunit n=1 Tax=Spirosoma telluris TaxID=2183553 RepID=A0A327NXR9_9BACT|nr:molybdopterin-dependent oxidoreductase [Spirosoma telluris]RAI77688.1 xanthine dehydrogenase family protein molybdopterin-binding subunit [Spirosoma telluris]
MKNRNGISRRNFIRQTGFSGIVLTIGAYLPASGKTEVTIINAKTTDKTGRELLSWISIDTSGKVTLRNHRSEMGQGTFQAIPQMIAEELEVNLDQVTIVFAPANPQKFGPQPQEGSFSVRGWYKQLLQIGASARQMLIDVAAKQWNVAASECYAENGQVIHRSSGKKLGYGLLVEEASRLTPPQNVPLKSRKDYKIIGKPLPRQDIPLKTNGTAQFGLDKKLPGMLYAMVERNPRFRGKVKRFDDSKTKAVPGVKNVFTVQRAVFGSLYEGVAVVADSLWAAMQGRKLLSVEWDDSGFDHLGTEQLATQMRENLKKPSPSEKFEVALQQAAKKMEAIYETPYQSHSCMEPLNCIAHVQDNRIDIWGPIQEANWIQADLSERMGVPKENVRVNMTFLGGGFGRKAFTDYPHEAALISKTMKAPVQVVWTREDDMRMGPFRPGAFYACKGGIDNNGHILAFQTITASQWIGQDWRPEPYPDPEPPGYNTGSMEGMVSPYCKAVPHYSFGGAGIRAAIPVMWWRSVYASTGGFACESFIDELAHEAGQDPLTFRRNHLPDKRYQALVDQLATISGWKSRGKHAGWGVAITECFGGICGHIVQVSRKTGGKLKIDKVIALIDCGWYVNPDIICAQVEGSILMGLGAAIKHATTFTDGKAVHQNFNTYDMPRITDTPEIEVHIMENEEKAGGVGEPGLPPFAPALCNAIFDLTGKRIRTLPFKLEEV